WEPNDIPYLYWVLGKLPGEEPLAFLRTHVHERPIQVEWHRAYQELTRKAHPGENLVPAYRQLVAETRENPDALYLLARLLDDDEKEAETLLRRGATATPPSAYATYALAYECLEQGRFDDAVNWGEKSLRLAPGNF